MMVSGINHITLSVKDIDESFVFYYKTLGFCPVAKWPEGAYLLAGDIWIALVVDRDTRQNPLPEYTHIAFTVTADDFQAFSRQIEASGAKIWQKNSSEGESLYFVDPNGHKFEIHASNIETRIKTAKENPWSGLEFFI